MKQIVTLENISCQNCVKHVTEHFLKLEGVSDVQIDLDTKVATLTAQQIIRQHLLKQFIKLLLLHRKMRLGKKCPSFY